MRLRKLCLSTEQDWKQQIRIIGADPGTWDRLSLKCSIHAFSTGYIDSTAANILKQCMLSGGADAIVSKDTVSARTDFSDALIVGTSRQILRGCTSLEGQPFDLGSLADDLRKALLSTGGAPDSIRAGGKTLEFTGHPLVMGILNITPDSFSDGGKFFDVNSAIRRALSMIEEGADILDIGAESTRPGSHPVPPDVQLERILPVLQAISPGSDAVISIDTTSSSVAKLVLEAGGDMINDVSSLSDPGMASVIAHSGAPIVLMHMRGSPADMQDEPWYSDVMEEVYCFLEERISMAEASGIPRERIIVDPGIGFGKRLKDNMQLISRLDELKWLGCRVLLGHSRKSFLRDISGIDDPQERETVTHAVTALSSQSADIVRVHDVKNTIDVLKVAYALGGGFA